MLEKLKTVLSEQVDIRNKDIDLETNLLTDLGLSSMDTRRDKRNGKRRI
ncbi:MAG: hypothetical protein ACI4EQ_01995 [Lachnospiraceae bacterium]